FPANVRAVVQLAAVHVAWFVEQVRLSFEAAEAMSAAFADGIVGLTVSDVAAEAERRRAANNANLRDSIDLILRERQATKDSAAAARAAAVERAAARQKELEDRRKALEERGGLGAFGLGAEGDGGGDAAKAAAADAARRDKQFMALVEDLRTEEEALADSYAVRRALIEEHTSAESELRRDLMERLEEWRSQGEASITEGQNREVEQLRQSLLT